jgi:CheY-like chemotaxis protein
MPRSILLIDDDPYLSQLITMGLARLGSHLSVRAAFSGSEGLSMAEIDPPDLILLDFYMPEMDGLETLQRLRANVRLACIPVVAISASITREGRFAAMIAGSEAYLPKPFDIEGLGRTIEHVMGSTSRANG